MSHTRRSFLRASAAAAGLAAVNPLKAMEAMATPLAPPLPPTGAAAPFDHIVVVMMENRSFDHLLGWLPGADGRDVTKVYTASDGKRYQPFNLGDDFQGCGDADPDHSWEGGLRQLNAGRMDGFLRPGRPGEDDPNDLFPIGYYDEAQVGFRGTLAQSYTVFDRYFQSILAETYPNRFYSHAAKTDRLHNMSTTNVSDPPGFTTIWDRLKAKGLEGRSYFTNLPFLALWGQKYTDILRPIDTFYADAASGNLPALSWVDPDFAGELANGASNDDHPRGDIRGGAAFLQQVYAAVRNGLAWDRTLLVINYDECGGFFDHVIPPTVAGPGQTIGPDWLGEKPGDDPLDPVGFSFNRLGFRVPCFLISPYAPAQVWKQGPYDHTSVLKMIEWRFGLDSLTTRDAQARNLAEALDFSVRRPDAQLPTGLPLVPFQGAACSASSGVYIPPAAVPDPVIPEVSRSVALPLSAAAAGAGAVLLQRRHRRAEEAAETTPST